MKVSAIYAAPQGRRYRWTRKQYERMIEAGIFDEDARVELIDGEVIIMSPQKSGHATAVMLTAEALRAAYGSGYMVRTQLPLALDPDSEPEPDISVVAGRPREYSDAHPKTATLVVEVAEASLIKDRTQKMQLYARHGLPTYWVVNVVEDTLEVYSNPADEAYQVKTTLKKGDHVIPPETEAEIAVVDILP